MDNAIKYTPAGGKVRVRAAVTDRGVELSVADSGPGIPAGDRAAGDRTLRAPGSQPQFARHRAWAFRWLRRWRISTMPNWCWRTMCRPAWRSMLALPQDRDPSAVRAHAEKRR